MVMKLTEFQIHKNLIRFIALHLYKKQLLKILLDYREVQVFIHFISENVSTRASYNVCVFTETRLTNNANTYFENLTGIRQSSFTAR